uniref:DOG1 domain-containing protein n=1 Tax=Steinernema glaseri TaxID=37863 RepID=A0A1I8AFS0_9BILA
MNANLRFDRDGALNVIKDTLIKVFLSGECGAIDYMAISATVRQSTRGLMHEALNRYLRQFISEKAAKIGALTTPVDRLLEYKSAWKKFKGCVMDTDRIFAQYKVHEFCMAIWMDEMFYKMPWVIMDSAHAVLDEEDGGNDLVKVVTNSLLEMMGIGTVPETTKRRGKKRRRTSCPETPVNYW